MSVSLDIPKSVTFALLPSPISRTLLLDRSLWMMALECRWARARGYIMADVELGVVREGTSQPL